MVSFTFRSLYPGSLRMGNLDAPGENYSIASWGIEPRTAGAAAVQELVRATPRLAIPVRLHTSVPHAGTVSFLDIALTGETKIRTEFRSGTETRKTGKKD